MKHDKLQFGYFIKYNSIQIEIIMGNYEQQDL